MAAPVHFLCGGGRYGTMAGRVGVARRLLARARQSVGETKAESA
jgi:hypothetical protein